ncbi:sugar ABC transporter permease [Clostridia bacterium]|nr:sugar ABC transporter permease [Clostridia bacterium]
MWKRSRGDKIFDACNVLFFILFGVCTLYPFWSLLMTSFMDATGYYNTTLNLWPGSGFKLDAYRYIFSTKWIPTGYLNTVVYTIGGTAWTMLLVCLASFAMTKPNLPGKRFFSLYFLLTMYFSGGIVPFYIIVTQYLKLYNTRLAMMITSGLSVWSYLVLRNFINAIPASLTESARIDGASEGLILRKVILPLCLPSMLTLTMMAFVAYWNDWFNALIFLQNEYLFPLQIIVRRMIIDTRITPNAVNEMKNAYKMQEGWGIQMFEPAIKAAVVMVTVIPIIIIYPFIQKYFDQGVMVGSIKE